MSPLLRETLQFHLRHIPVGSVVYKLHVFGKLLLVLPDHVVGEVPDLVDHAYLGVSHGENIGYGPCKPVQVVGDRHQDIFNPTGFKVGHHTLPEGGRLVLAKPHPKYLLVPLPVESDCQVDGLVDDLARLAYLENDTVHPDNAIDRLERAVLPVQHLLVHLVRNDGYGRSGEPVTVDFLKLLSMSEALIPFA